MMLASINHTQLIKVKLVLILEFAINCLMYRYMYGSINFTSFSSLTNRFLPTKESVPSGLVGGGLLCLPLRKLLIK